MIRLVWLHWLTDSSWYTHIIVRSPNDQSDWTPARNFHDYCLLFTHLASFPEWLTVKQILRPGVAAIILMIQPYMSGNDHQDDKWSCCEGVLTSARGADLKGRKWAGEMNLMIIIIIIILRNASIRLPWFAEVRIFLPTVPFDVVGKKKKTFMKMVMELSWWFVIIIIWLVIFIH